jgi:hypothetical protein
MNSSSDADLLFKAVHDISTEGLVVYRARLDGNGRVVDFEYRYANPAACAIMRGQPDDVVGAMLLERLPEAREHPISFPAMRKRSRAGRPRRRNTNWAEGGTTAGSPSSRTDWW